MSCRGRIINGVVAPEEQFPWPEGTEVVVAPAEPAAHGSLADQFRELIGSVEDLPPDMAKNHDHYIHGTPKQ